MSLHPHMFEALQWMADVSPVHPVQPASVSFGFMLSLLGSWVAQVLEGCPWETHKGVVGQPFCYPFLMSTCASLTLFAAQKKTCMNVSGLPILLLLIMVLSSCFESQSLGSIEVIDAARLISSALFSAYISQGSLLRYRGEICNALHLSRSASLCKLPTFLPGTLE